MKLLGLNSPEIFIILVILLLILGPNRIEKGFLLFKKLLKFLAFPDDDEYLDNLWNFTHNNILDNCGEFVDINDLKDLEIFFKEEGLIASNRELYLPTFENN